MSERQKRLLRVHCMFCGKLVEVKPAGGGAAGDSRGGMCWPPCAKADDWVKRLWEVGNAQAIDTTFQR